MKGEDASLFTLHSSPKKMIMHPSFQSLLIPMEKERLELFAELEARSDEALNRGPGPGKWSPIQVMHHLIISEELSLRYLQKKLSYNPTLKKAGPAAFWRRWVLKTYLWLPFKFKAPKAVNDEALPRYVSFVETKARWEKIRKEITDFLEQAPKELLDKEVYKHLVAGRLTLEGMLEFFLYHSRRHMAQIRRSLD